MYSGVYLMMYIENTRYFHSGVLHCVYLMAYIDNTIYNLSGVLHCVSSMFKPEMLV